MDFRVISAAASADILPVFHIYNPFFTRTLRVRFDIGTVDAEELIVIYDDLDLEAGALRLRKFGSAGTHNGMRSVVQHLNSDRFPRIRLGIGGNGKRDIIDHVIGGFTKDEVPVLEEAVTKAVSAIECMLGEGIDRAMSQYNTKKKSKKAEKKDEEVKENEEKGNC